MALGPNIAPGCIPIALRSNDDPASGLQNLNDADYYGSGELFTFHAWDSFQLGYPYADLWFGFTSKVRRNWAGLDYQGGGDFYTAGTGGWFASGLVVQVADVEATPTEPDWVTVSGLSSSPSYPYTEAGGDWTHTYQLRFNATPGFHIRIYGVPGGTQTFVGCANLAAYEEGESSAKQALMLTSLRPSMLMTPACRTIAARLLGTAPIAKRAIQTLADGSLTQVPVGNEWLKPKMVISSGVVSQTTAHTTKPLVHDGAGGMREPKNVESFIV